MVPSSAEDLAADAGLLLDLAHRGLLGGLAGLDVALGQRPQQPAVAVGAPDERAARDVAGEVDDQAAGAELVDLAQPAAARPPRRRRPSWRAAGRAVRALGHGPMVTAGVGTLSRP